VPLSDVFVAARGLGDIVDYRVVRTDARGQFSLGALPIGHYTLRIFHDGYRGLLVPLEIVGPKGRASIDKLQFRLPPVSAR
jgi:hypothetical protein